MKVELLKKFAEVVQAQKLLAEERALLVTPEMRQVDEKIKELKSEEAKMRAEIVTHLRDENVDKYGAAFGTFSILENERWEYSDEFKFLEETIGEAIKNLRDQLEAARKLDEESGRAKKVPGDPTLRFQAPKVQDGVKVAV